jgi:hypothetical protein
VTDIRFASEALQHDHDAKTFGFATEGPSLKRQEFAEKCDINVLMAYGRCLRPALYSSLRSSPSHPTGVSALRVTIAIADARFARKQWGASQVDCQSGGSFAMNRPPADVFGQALLDDSPQRPVLHFFRKSPRVPRVSWLGSWALGTSDRGGQDKARKVRAVGRGEESSKFNRDPNIASYRAHLAMFANALSSLNFRHPMSPR